MKRQEFLVNLTLLTLIGALVYTILQSDSPDEDLTPPDNLVAAVTEGGAGSESGRTETPYVRERDVYRSLGTKPLFQALITPTPPPPTPTPTPTPTPDINVATANLKITSVMDGIVIVEPKKPDPRLFPDGLREMRVGDTLAVDVGKGEMKTLTLKQADDKTNPDNPSAVFALEGSTELKVLRMFDDPVMPMQ